MSSMTVSVSKMMKNKYGAVQELRSTFSHINSVNIDFSLVWFLCVHGQDRTHQNDDM